MQFKKLFLIQLDWESIRLCRHLYNNKKTFLSLLNSAFCLIIAIKTEILTPSMYCTMAFEIHFHITCYVPISFLSL